MGPIWDAELRVWDAKNFGPVSPGTHRSKFVKKSLYFTIYERDKFPDKTVFLLILNIPVNNFSVMSERVFLGLTSTKQSIKCLAQGHNAVPPLRFKPATP